MLQEQRFKVIRDHLMESRSISVVELTELLDVSRETIRRDLIRMSELGLIKKVHGGAVLNKVSEEPPYAFRIEHRYDEKRAIARAAVDLVEDGDTLFIDTGTTTLAFAQMLSQKVIRPEQGIRVVTNSMPIASLLCQVDIDVYLTGGRIRKEELSLSGLFANHLAENIQVDKAICGVSGIDVRHGIVDFHLEEAELRKKIIDRAGQVIMLADYTKFSSTAFVTVCPLSAVDVIITDSQAPRHAIAEVEGCGVRVLVASETA